MGFNGGEAGGKKSMQSLRTTTARGCQKLGGETQTAAAVRKHTVGRRVGREVQLDGASMDLRMGDECSCQRSERAPLSLHVPTSQSFVGVCHERLCRGIQLLDAGERVRAQGPQEALVPALNRRRSLRRKPRRTDGRKLLDVRRKGRKAKG